MKKILIVSFIFISLVAVAGAEPLILNQAKNILPANKIEAGAGFNYGYSKYYYSTATTTEYETKDSIIPAFVRYGITDEFEALAKIEYKMLTRTEGSISKNGFGYCSIFAKYLLMENLAIGVNGDISIGSPDDSLTQGLNLGGKLIYSYPLCPDVIMHVNAGYNYSFEFTMSSTKIDLGNVIPFGIGFEYNMGNIIPIIEFYGSYAGKTLIAGAETGDTMFMYSVVPSVLVKYDNFKIKAGWEYAFDKYNLYNWRIISSISYVF